MSFETKSKLPKAQNVRTAHQRMYVNKEVTEAINLLHIIGIKKYSVRDRSKKDEDRYSVGRMDIVP